MLCFPDSGPIDWDRVGRAARQCGSHGGIGRRLPGQEPIGSDYLLYFRINFRGTLLGQGLETSPNNLLKLVAALDVRDRQTYYNGNCAGGHNGQSQFSP